MLTIKKESTLLQKYGVFAAAFAVGLITSLGALHMIDPKTNASVVQASEPTHKEETVSTPVKSTPASAQRADTAGTSATLVEAQPTYQAEIHHKSPMDEAETEIPSVSANANEQAEIEEPTREKPTTNDGGLFSLPIVELLFAKGEGQDR